eukprot:CAMPEP_0201943550 /NCGR_PEP_ID=MMETSP0903-20130614/51320_1 /ASSEMBLY_ACC=CAM_ASM_000552 /TAXON_ID=420261 /ORGANISM="Thalassiosira antarctica, Strain CCMP982" /LENGTH=50 /DNA_ID=CAMNT_0048486263 /DNA_START=100 /DNA_END=248 /DNA_ORIENTATION=-
MSECDLLINNSPVPPSSNDGIECKGIQKVIIRLVSNGIIRASMCHGVIPS